MTKPTRIIPMPSVTETINIYNGKRKTIIKWGGKTYKTHTKALKDRQKFIDKLKSREDKNNGRK